MAKRVFLQKIIIIIIIRRRIIKSLRQLQVTLDADDRLVLQNRRAHRQNRAKTEDPGFSNRAKSASSPPKPCQNRAKIGQLGAQPVSKPSRAQTHEPRFPFDPPGSRKRSAHDGSSHSPPARTTGADGRRVTDVIQSRKARRPNRAKTGGLGARMVHGLKHEGLNLC